MNCNFLQEIYRIWTFWGVVQNVARVDAWKIMFFNPQSIPPLISVDMVFVPWSLLSLWISLIEISGCYLYVCASPLQCFNSALWSFFDSWQWVPVNKRYSQYQSTIKQKKPSLASNPADWLRTSLCLCCHNITAIVISSLYLSPLLFSEEQISPIKSFSF